MARRNKSQAQNVPSVPYGRHQELAEQMKQAPLPVGTNLPLSDGQTRDAAAAAPGPVQGQPVATPQDPMQAALAAAAAMTPPEPSLYAPSARPWEPVTHGLYGTSNTPAMPQQAPALDPTNDPMGVLRAAQDMYPNQDVLDYINRWGYRG